MFSNLFENHLMLDEDRNELQNPKVVKELVRLAAASLVGWTFSSQFWDILENLEVPLLHPKTHLKKNEETFEDGAPCKKSTSLRGPLQSHRLIGELAMQRC